MPFKHVMPSKTILSDATINLPGTQMTLVLIGKDLVLEGSTTKLEDKQVPGTKKNIRKKNQPPGLADGCS